MVILMQPEDMSDSRWPQLLNYFISLTFLDGSTVILQDMCVILDFALIVTLHALFLSRVTSFFMLSLTSFLSLHPTTTLRPWGKGGFRVSLRLARPAIVVYLPSTLAFSERE